MIKTISLENWKSHYKTNLVFEKGTNVIVGISGSGKTSVMDAISFALYGTFPSLAARKVTLEETIMSKPVKQEKSNIKMEFNYNNKNYLVERSVRRNGMSEAYLHEDEKIIAGPKTTDVTKKITQLLEVNYDLFSRAIYSEQNQIDFFLRLSASQRKEKFDELLGLDKYEKVRTNSVTLLNRIKKMNEDRKIFVSEQKKKTNPGQIKEYEKKIEEKQLQTEKTSIELEKIKKEINEKEDKIKEAEQKEKELRALKESEIKFKSRIDSLQEQLLKLNEKLKGIDSKGAQEELGTNEKAILEINNEKKEFKKNLEEKEKEKISIKEQKAVQKNLLESNQNSLTNYKKLGTDCPICKRPLSEHDKEKLKSEIALQDEKIKQLITGFDSLLQKISKQYEEIENKMGEKDKEKEAIQKRIEQLKRNSEILVEKEEKEKMKNELQKQLDGIKMKINKIDFDADVFEKQKKEFYSLRERGVKMSTEISSSKELLRELDQTVKRIKDAQQQIKELEEKIKENEKMLEKLSIFISALRATQEELRGEMIETVNAAMEQVWIKIYPYEDINTIKIVAEENSYEIMARQANNEWNRVEGILSGGERSAVAITMRIAISLVLTQNLGWIILDEPTHNLDANSVKELSQTMANHMPQFIEQIFIITHDKEMENAASGKLYTLEREKGKDGVTKISN